MIRLFGKIPFVVTPAFWLVSCLLGYLNSGSIPGTVIWVLVIFISVLVHELGHALTALAFQLKPSIELVAFGGITRHFGSALSFGKQFLIVLAGPFFGFCLFLGSAILNYYSLFQSGFFFQFFHLLQVVNLFWTLLNVLPLFPLDGGQMLRLMLEAVFGRKGIRFALMVSTVIALFGMFVFLSQKMFLVGIFFSLFAYQSYIDYRKVKEYLEEDLKGDLAALFALSEKYMQAGKNGEAKEGFYKILSQIPEGKSFALCSQYLALIEAQEGNKEKAYDLLLGARKKLNEEGLVLLEKLAFDMKNYTLVVELSKRSSAHRENLDSVLAFAKSHAQMGQFKECLGWLESALELGLPNPKQELLDPLFDPIRERNDFREWKRKRKF